VDESDKWDAINDDPYNGESLQRGAPAMGNIVELDESDKWDVMNDGPYNEEFLHGGAIVDFVCSNSSKGLDREENARFFLWPRPGVCIRAMTD
jgi:hypothetical protein